MRAETQQLCDCHVVGKMPSRAARLFNYGPGALSLPTLREVSRGFVYALRQRFRGPLTAERGFSIQLCWQRPPETVRSLCQSLSIPESGIGSLAGAW